MSCQKRFFFLWIFSCGLLLSGQAINASEPSKKQHLFLASAKEINNFIQKYNEYLTESKTDELYLVLDNKYFGDYGEFYALECQMLDCSGPYDDHEYRNDIHFWLYKADINNDGFEEYTLTYSEWATGGGSDGIISVFRDTGQRLERIPFRHKLIALMGGDARDQPDFHQYPFITYEQGHYVLNFESMSISRDINGKQIFKNQLDRVHYTETTFYKIVWIDGKLKLLETANKKRFRISDEP